MKLTAREIDALRGLVFCATYGKPFFKVDVKIVKRLLDRADKEQQ